MGARGRVDGTFNSELDAYRHYPALLAVWVAGLAAIAAEREAFLADLLTKPTWRPQFNDRTPQPVADALHPYSVLNGDWLNGMPRWGGTRYIYPASRLLRVEAREPVRTLLPDSEVYDAACDRLECLASFVACDPASGRRNLPWMGEFIINGQYAHDGHGLAPEIAEEIDDQWPMLAAFDGDIERASKAATAAVEFIRERGRTW